MSRWAYRIIPLWALIEILVLAMFILALTAHGAHSHEWYSHRQDPVTKHGCCGGTDCAQLIIGPGTISAEPSGYRVRLSIEEARRINAYRIDALDTIVPWDRVQDSEDGNYHICIPTQNGRVLDEIYCFFAPPNT